MTGGASFSESLTPGASASKASGPVPESLPTQSSPKAATSNDWTKPPGNGWKRRPGRGAQIWLFAGAVNAGLAIALDALGAHRWRPGLEPDAWDVFQTAQGYHLHVALGLILVGVLAAILPPGRVIHVSGSLLALGLTLFCGSLYLRTILGWAFLGPLTPLGGLCLISGWLMAGGAVILQKGR